MPGADVEPPIGFGVPLDPGGTLPNAWSHATRIVWDFIPETDREPARDVASALITGLREPDGTLRWETSAYYTRATYA